MKTIGLILTIVVLTSVTTVLNAQYTGPGPQPVLLTVKEISDDAMKLDRKDTIVKLKGFIVEQSGDDNYQFKDSTGKIRIEISKKHMPAATFNDKTEVVIKGEVDYDLLEGTEIEVKSVEFVNPELNRQISKSNTNSELN